MSVFYLAARFSRLPELCGYRSELEALGHEVPARWLLGEHQVHGVEAARAVEQDGPVPSREARLFADDDIEDILAADAIVCFTEQPRSGLGSRGGRHVEYGFALGLRVMGRDRPRIYVVGPLENVFHARAEVDGAFDTWQAFKAAVVVPAAGWCPWCTTHVGLLTDSRLRAHRWDVRRSGDEPVLARCVGSGLSQSEIREAMA